VVIFFRDSYDILIMGVFLEVALPSACVLEFTRRQERAQELALTPSWMQVFVVARSNDLISSQAVLPVVYSRELSVKRSCSRWAGRSC
jgi:hypothetical protein